MNKQQVWKPVEDGVITLFTGGDNVGVPRPKEIVLHGTNKVVLVMSSLSMAGESRVGYTMRWSEKYAICELVDAGVTVQMTDARVGALRLVLDVLGSAAERHVLRNEIGIVEAMLAEATRSNSL
jgi:hypothetical protein